MDNYVEICATWAQLNFHLEEIIPGDENQVDIENTTYDDWKVDACFARYVWTIGHFNKSFRFGTLSTFP